MRGRFASLVCIAVLTVASAASARPSPPDPRIAAARRHAGNLLSIFPGHFGTVACRIGYGGPTGGVMPGTCTTGLGRLPRGPNFGGWSLIVFTERWQWPPRGRQGRHRTFSHTWSIWLGPALKILAVKESGAPAPQDWA